MEKGCEEILEKLQKSRKHFAQTKKKHFDGNCEIFKIIFRRTYESTETSNNFREELLSNS